MKKPVSCQINSYLSVLFYKETRVQRLSRGLRVNRSRFEPWSGCCGLLFFFFFYFVISYRFHQTSVLLWPIFMATASYAGEAIMLSSWVSEYNNRIQTTSSPTAKSAEFTRYSSLFAFVYFSTSSGVQHMGTISLNRLGYHSELARDYTFSRCYIFFLPEY